MHVSWVNSAALNKANIDASTPDPPGGRIGRFESGKPNGILYENACDFITSVMPEPSTNIVANNMRLAQEQFWENGVTGLHDYDHKISFDAIKQLYQENRLGIRIVKNMLIPINIGRIATAPPYIGILNGSPNK